MTNHRTTVANGNELCLWGHGKDTAARRVAATLPRNLDGLRRVEADIVNDAICWFEPPEGDHATYNAIEIPEGYCVTQIDHFARGTVAVSVEVA